MPRRFWMLFKVGVLTGVARAPDQNAGVSAGAYSINTDADVMVHGGRLGLQFTYQARVPLIRPVSR